MTRFGSVAALWRHPVKSLGGETVEAADLGPAGLLGDRSHVLVDARTGKALSAKNPKKWPRLLELRASFVSPPTARSPWPSIAIRFPDGSSVRSDEAGAEARLSEFLGGAVRLVSETSRRPAVEVYWPDLEGLPGRDAMDEFRIRTGPFYDSRPLLVVTNATLQSLAAAYPSGRFDPRRFRPNLLVDTDPGVSGQPEQSLVGQSVRIGAVDLRVTKPCTRCVMTTRPQGDLPEDLGILRTVVAEARGRVGVYAEPLAAGTVRRGDPVVVLEPQTLKRATG